MPHPSASASANNTNLGHDNSLSLTLSYYPSDEMRRATIARMLSSLMIEAWLSVFRNNRQHSNLFNAALVVFILIF